MIRLPDWLNPWAANRRLRAQLSTTCAELADADRLAEIACEQYDRLREANAQLREALNMLRDSNHKLWAENSALLRERAGPPPVWDEYDTERGWAEEDK